MLGETEKSSDVCRTASLSEMGHEQRAATSSTMTDQRRKNLARCPSVRPSHAGILSKWLNISSFVFSPSSSQTILVFLHQTGWQYSDGDTHNEGVEYKGVWKNHNVRPIFRFISAIMHDRARVTMEREKKTAPSVRMAPSWMILSDL